MIAKHPINVARLRKVPKKFSWVDHRLIGDRHIDKCSVPAAALYLFLVTVSDANGLSYYSDRSICSRLSMDVATLTAARANLIEAYLIAFKSPLYQVLSLDLTPPVARSSMDSPLSLGDILKKAAARGGL